MNIVKVWPESIVSDKRLMYKLSRSESTSLQKVAGEEITPKAWMVREDTNHKGENVTVLSIVDDNNNVYSTISKTFMSEFDEINRIMDGEDFSVLVKAGVTKGGKDFITCELI